MAKLTDAQANEKVRQNFLQNIIEIFSEKGEEIMQVSTNALAIPTVNELGNEIYLKLTVSIPRGERGGPAYDGHQEAEDYKVESAEKERIKAQKIIDRQRAEERKAKQKEKE